VQTAEELFSDEGDDDDESQDPERDLDSDDSETDLDAGRNVKAEYLAPE